MAKAETRQRREKKLEHFFREAYALTFGLRPSERRRRSDATVDGEVVTVMRTSLTKSEFASALGMKSDAVFVKKMFNIVDKDGDGRISFQVNILRANIKRVSDKSFDFLFRNFWTLLCCFRVVKPRINCGSFSTCAIMTGTGSLIKGNYPRC